MVSVWRARGQELLPSLHAVPIVSFARVWLTQRSPVGWQPGEGLQAEYQEKALPPPGPLGFLETSSSLVLKGHSSFISQMSPKPSASDTTPPPITHGVSLRCHHEREGTQLESGEAISALLGTDTKGGLPQPTPSVSEPSHQGQTTLDPGLLSFN